MKRTLTIQSHWDGAWHDTGDVVFADTSKGLTGSMQFYYHPEYVNKADDLRPGLDFTDERSIGVNIPGNFAGHYGEKEIAPVLRDIIPQGAGRRALLKLWGVDNADRTGPERDFQLLSEGCVAPVGNLRIKEAAENFAERTANRKPLAFTRDDVSERNEEMIDYAHSLGIAIGGATGAGGDAPKLLLVEDRQGQLYMEGTLDEADVHQHWLVKFPRGRMLQDDEDVLRGEGVFYNALSRLGEYTIEGAELREGRTPSLWLPRFDRELKDGRIVRYGLESVYSMMQMIGDGARLEHPAVLEVMQEVTDIAHDDLLVEYLVRDAINIAIGNSDNHGRNTALLKRDGIVHLAPAFDLAPMVLDREAVARTTVWPRAYQTRNGETDYPGIVQALAEQPESVAKALATRFEALAELQSVATQMGLPAAVAGHSSVRMTRFEDWAEEMRQGATQSLGPAPHI